MNPDDCLVVITNLPDRQSADRLARHLVGTRLAACANILSPCHSVYRWQGNIETAEEIPVMIKTTRRSYPALEWALREAHPYEVPEILAVAATGLPAYLDWVVAETGGDR
jgi:periplasmic divalent cation tolerance protein